MNKDAFMMPVPSDNTGSLQNLCLEIFLPENKAYKGKARAQIYNTV